MSDAHYRRVVLPRLTRPNLVARLYMLFTAMRTVGEGWGLPESPTARILESGGITAHLVIATVVLATALGLLDAILNDLMEMRGRVHAEGLLGRFVGGLEDRRSPRCFLLGGCYLVLTYAGSGSSVTGTSWLLVSWIQMALCAGLLAWGLRALASATVVSGRNAQA